VAVCHHGLEVNFKDSATYTYHNASMYQISAKFDNSQLRYWCCNQVFQHVFRGGGQFCSV